jgi:transposase, IS5 family
MADMAQMVFLDTSGRYTSLDAKKAALAKINVIVPCEEFRPLLEQVWRKPDSKRKSRAGRRLMDAVLMFQLQFTLRRTGWMPTDCLDSVES